MKIFFLIFLLLPLKLLSQDFTGVWTGSIYNDTTQKYIPYEIAIDENNGKLTGFSHVIFLINGKEETGVKSVKIKKKDDRIFIEDEQLIYNNYAEPAPKGVKQRSTLTISESNTEMILSGPFNTNRTKDYYPVTGTIKLKKKKDFSQTKIIPKLSELNLTKTLSFLQPKKEKEDVAVIPEVKTIIPVSQPVQTENKAIAVALISKEPAPELKPKVKEEEVFTDPVKIKNVVPLLKTKDKNLANTQQVSKASNIITPVQKQTTAIELPKEIKTIAVATTTKINGGDSARIISSSKASPVLTSQKNKEKDIALSTTSAKTKPPVILQKNKEKDAGVLIQGTKMTPVIQTSKSEKLVVKTESLPIKKLVTVSQPEKKKEIIVTQAENKNSSVQTIPEKKQPVIIPVIKTNTPQFASLISASDLAKRKIETIKSVYFKSDSLTLTLYDNGEVDGDTVSILLNGKVIMPRVGLSTIAIKKTIYITPDLGDSLQIIMYAENLGSIPPNTGLLILQDGDDRYEIRFAGDLQKNSAIILRRKSLGQ